MDPERDNAVEESQRSNSIQSVDRAISVMEFLSSREWAGVTEVAAEMDIHKSTAYRLLTTLRDRGLVDQDAATEKYRLGFGLVLLARSVTAQLDLMRCARPICEQLSQSTEETVTLAVLEEEESVVIHQSLSRSSVLSVDWNGQHNPLHATASGKVLLGSMNRRQRRRALKDTMELFTERTLVEMADIEENLAGIERTGYSTTIEELEVGLNAVAAPIRYADGRIVAAVSLSGPAFRLPEETIEESAAKIKAAAAEISHCLGYREKR